MVSTKKSEENGFSSQCFQLNVACTLNHFFSLDLHKAYFLENKMLSLEIIIFALLI